MADGAGLAHQRSLLHAQMDAFQALCRDTRAWTTAPSPFSAWPPLVHAEHMARAGHGSVTQLEKALERDGGPAIHPLGQIVLWTGWIPRGLGKAPPSTAPQRVDRAEVSELFAALGERIDALDLGAIAAGRGRSHHPVFGGFSARQWFRFLDVHHRHHLRIIHDLRGPLEVP